MEMRSHTRVLAVAALAATLLALTSLAVAASGRGAQHVRWDIISLTAATTPPTMAAGGHAEAKAPDGERIRLTGHGTFVAPPGGNGGSGAVTGGGTWQTFNAAGAPTGSGSYAVTALVSWEFANVQTATFNDTIDEGRRANGTAVLQITFSDGEQGVLTVGCHGPGAPPGIFEGIATTKAFKTFYDVQPPTAGVDANRTIFHVR